MKQWTVKQFKQTFPEADKMPTQVPDRLPLKSWLLPWTICFPQPCLWDRRSCTSKLGKYFVTFTTHPCALIHFNFWLLQLQLRFLYHMYTHADWPRRQLPLFYQPSAIFTNWRTNLTQLRHFWFKNFWKRSVKKGYLIVDFLLRNLFFSNLCVHFRTPTLCQFSVPFLRLCSWQFFTHKGTSEQEPWAWQSSCAICLSVIFIKGQFHTIFKDNNLSLKS